MADWAATGGCPSEGGGTRGRAAPGDAVGVSARRPAAGARGWGTLTRMRAHEGRGGPRGGALMTGKRAHQGDRPYPYDGGSSSAGGRGHATPRRPVPRAAPATCERAWRDGACLQVQLASDTSSMARWATTMVAGLLPKVSLAAMWRAWKQRNPLHGRTRHRRHRWSGASAWPLMQAASRSQGVRRPALAVLEITTLSASPMPP